MKRFLQAAICICMIICFSEGCNMETSVEIKDLDKLIEALKAWPDQWETTITDSINKYEEMNTDLSLRIAGELKSLIEETNMMIQESIFCTIDFVIDRAVTRIEGIKHDVLPLFFSEPVYVPWVCSTVPDKISLDSEMASFSGYNFKNYKGKFIVNIEYESGEIIKDISTALLVKSDYTINIDLKSVNLRVIYMDPVKSPRLVLRWEGGDSGILIQTIKVEMAWERTFAGGKACSVQSTSSDGGYIVGGHDSNQMLYILKVDSEGNKIWDKTATGPIMIP